MYPLNFRRFLPICLFKIVLVAIFVFGSLTPVNGQLELKVMTFNVWTADNQTTKLAEIVRACDADIIGLQEMNDSPGQQLANQLGYYWNADVQALSGFPVVSRSAAGRGLEIEITPGHNVFLFNAHLAPFPYQPYDLRDDPSLSETQLISMANAARGHQVTDFLNSIATSVNNEDRVIFTGDFNEPSHLDWTQAAADATPRNFDKKVEFPASKRITDVGFVDSFREFREDEINDRAYTWTPGYPPPNTAANEVHDRIDIIYFRGPEISVVSSQTLGLSAANSNTDIGIPNYSSDHRAVVSGLFVDGLQFSKLTFSRLAHNPGDDSALSQGNYGDNLVTSPNVIVEYLATPGAHWDTYDGDVDGNGNNNWKTLV